MIDLLISPLCEIDYISTHALAWHDRGIKHIYINLFNFDDAINKQDTDEVWEQINSLFLTEFICLSVPFNFYPMCELDKFSSNILCPLNKILENIGCKPKFLQ